MTGVSGDSFKAERLKEENMNCSVCLPKYRARCDPNGAFGDLMHLRGWCAVTLQETRAPVNELQEPLKNHSIEFEGFDPRAELRAPPTGS
jgi:hypothetical protein